MCIVLDTNVGTEQSWPAFKPISVPREIDQMCETRTINFGIKFYLDKSKRKKW